MIVYYFSMQLSQAKCKSYYAGQITAVVVTSDQGETIQLPLAKFRPFMTSNGLKGRFRLILDDNHKFADLEKVY